MISAIQKGARDPYLVARKLNEQYYRFRGTNWFNERGTGIFELDWDNLIILDACRFDVFEEHSQLEGESGYRYTLGSRTEEFIRANFSDELLNDLIYVSENSWYRKLEDEIDATVFKWEFCNDDEIPTDHQATETALRLASEYPNKRLLVHFIPPHHPYYGPLADELLPDWGDQHDALFKRIRKGEIDVSDGELRDIYVENFERVLPHVRQLLDALPGKTVVSADHGECLGERSSPIPIKMYGHNPTTYTEELTKVPWHVSESGSRKTIQEGAPEESDNDIDDREIDEHLRDLGYVV